MLALARIATAALLVSSFQASAQALSVAAQLDEAERKWEAVKPDSYEFTFRFGWTIIRLVGCESGTFRVRVKRTSFISLSSCSFLKKDYGSIPALFRYIRSEEAKHPDVLQVTFDPTLGYPVTYFVDPSKQESDDTFHFEVTDFKISRK
jgi:hypothetical protein